MTNRGSGGFGPIDDLSASEYSLVGGSLGSLPVKSFFDSGGLSHTGSFISMGDLNGDGLADYAVLNQGGLQVCLRTVEPGPPALDFRCTSLSFNDLNWPGADYPYTTPHPPGIAPLAIADIDGSGIPQLVLWGRTFSSPGIAAGDRLATVRATPIARPRPGLLDSITSYTGAKTILQYDSLNNLVVTQSTPPGIAPAPVWVVVAKDVNNGIDYQNSQSRSLSTYYEYVGPIYDPRDRQFLGFTKVTERHPGETGAPGAIRTTTFATTACSGPTCIGSVDYSAYRLTRGLPVLIEESGTDKLNTRTTLNQYQWNQLLPGLDGRSVWLDVLGKATVYSWDPVSQSTADTTMNVALPPNVLPIGINGSMLQPTPAVPTFTASLPTIATVVTRTTGYDTFGNVVSTLDNGPGIADFTLRNSLSWQLPGGDNTGWSYRLTHTEIGYQCAYEALCGGVRARDYSYDNLGRLVSVSAILKGSQPLVGPDGTAATFAAGQPLGASVEGAPINQVQNIGYDGSGNALEVQGPNGRCTRIEYDALFAQLPTKATAFLNGCGGSQSLVTDRVYDRGLEIVTRQSAPYSPGDVLPRFAITKPDGFGRTIEVDSPSAEMLGTTAMNPAVKNVIYYDTGPIRVISYQTVDGRESTPVYVDHYRFVDAFGDTLATVDQSGPVGGPLQYTVSGVHTRFGNGLVKKRYQPSFIASSPTQFVAPANYDAISSPSRTATYDGLGRILTSTDFKGAVTTTKYRLGMSNVALSAKVLDPEQQPGAGHAGSFTTTFSDFLGRVTQRTLHLNQGSGGGPTDVTASATYLATGETSTLAQGNYERWMLYDSLGRLVGSDHQEARDSDRPRRA